MEGEVDRGIGTAGDDRGMRTQELRTIADGVAPTARAVLTRLVLEAREDVVVGEYRNLRRQINVNNPALYDPEIKKVVVVGDDGAAE
jgi:hypothetical protein